MRRVAGAIRKQFPDLPSIDLADAWRDALWALVRIVVAGPFDLLDSLRWLDGEVRSPIVDRLQQGQEAWCDLPATRPEEQDGGFEEKLLEWSERRAGLVRRLDGMGPDDWLAIARHRTRGPFHLAELLRDWVEEDSERFQRLLAPRDPS